MSAKMLIDIRSDTVTAPTAVMRRAMAEAETGDDVYGDDPTVKKLEELGAGLTGKEASLFVPSGTFGNQLALFTWCPRGSEVLIGENCHIIHHEAGGAAVIAGVQTRPVDDTNGIPRPEDLAARYRTAPGISEPSKFAVTKGRSFSGRNPHFPATSLLCLENAHSSGRAAPLAAMEEVRAFARSKALPVHLDGARIFNAAAALECKAGDIAAQADSVMFCLSKGLCAPIGSLLAGPRDFVEEARCKRKIMGGGMRQVGVLAAAGIAALTEHPPLLAGDHRRARKLEQSLSEIPGVRVERGDINMVFFTWMPEEARKLAAVPETGQIIADAFRKEGILISPPENTVCDGAAQWRFRFVTHYWIGDKELETVISAARGVFTGT